MATENDNAPAAHQPYVPDHVNMPEFTWSAVLVGAFLGILFGASSLYLVLKVGMTVSASVPIAVLSITLFRAFSRLTGFRRATILENNIVQTTGSAGESIAFGVGVTMPALLLLGFEMDIIRVMTVSVLGGLLGILMMIPLRRAFIVKQHGTLTYPEGTACAEVLVAGEKGGSTARMVFVGFGIAVMHKILYRVLKLWAEEPTEKLYTTGASGAKVGLPGAAVGGELSPELLGVGFLIGPRISLLMMAGGVLSYFVLGPMIAGFGEDLYDVVSPAKVKLTPIPEPAGAIGFGGERPGEPHDAWRIAGMVGMLAQPDLGPLAAASMTTTHVENKGLIRSMGPGELKANYLRYIGAGAVAAGGIISMLRALPLILSSILSGLRDLRATQSGGKQTTARTERDLSMIVVLVGSVGMVLVMMFVPALGLGFSLYGLLGALMILVFGFLFVTVSSRLTGEIGSSSNPISGMTIATLLLTCLIFLIARRTIQVDPTVTLTALTVAAVVCIASSNGGTTSQDLKTGFLIGATPRDQQISILVGALTSALVIGGTMLLLDVAGTHYTNQVPIRVLTVPPDSPSQKVGRPHEDDDNVYRIVHVRDGDYADVKPGRYLVDDQGRIKYRTDLAINQENKTMDNGKDAPRGFSAPQPQLFSDIITGILGGTLQWGLFIVGVLVALTLELAGVRALPVAVGMYLPISASTPIFAGGILRWVADRIRGVSASEAESETSPGVLLSSGYIAGGTLAGLLIAFFAFMPDAFNEAFDLSKWLPHWGEEDLGPKIVALAAFAVIAAILLYAGTRKSAGLDAESPAAPPPPPPGPDTRIQP